MKIRPVSDRGPFHAPFSRARNTCYRVIYGLSLYVEAPTRVVSHVGLGGENPTRERPRAVSRERRRARNTSMSFTAFLCTWRRQPASRCLWGSTGDASDDVVSTDVVSDDVVSDDVVSDDVVSDDMVSDDMVSDDMVSDDVVSADVVSADVVSDDVVSADVVSADVVSADVVSDDMVSDDMVSDDVVSTDVVSDDVVSDDVVSDDVVFVSESGPADDDSDSDDSDSDDVIFVSESGPTRRPLHFFKTILTHRVVTASGRLIALQDINAGTRGTFQYLVRFSENDEEIWLDESMFADDSGDYCNTFIEYCSVYGIVY